MDKSHAQAQETRKRNEQIRKERREREQAERVAQVAALRHVRILEDCGFYDSSHFTRFFRKITGCLPSEYRRENGR